MRAAMRTPSRSVAFSAGAIGAHVLDAGLRIAGDAERRGEIGRGIEARRRDRHRQRGEPLSGRADRRRVITTSWHGGGSTRTGAIGCAMAFDPGGRRSPRPAGPCRSNRCAARPPARRPRPACRSGGRAPSTTLREQEGAALILGEAALELPAHQRMQLGVLVDRPIDADQQALRFERAPDAPGNRAAAARRAARPGRPWSFQAWRTLRVGEGATVRFAAQPGNRRRQRSIGMRPLMVVSQSVCGA